MELHNHRSNNAPTRRLDGEAAKAALEPTIQDVRVERQGQEETSAERTRDRDSLELSPAARLFGDSVDSDREALIESLRAAHENGDLNTRTRLERAAHNMLAGK